MKTQLFSLGLLLLAVFTAAMSVNAQTDEINRVEFFAGYSHNRIDTGLSSEDLGSEFDRTFGGRRGANGFNASVTGNFSKYVGVKFDFATHGTTDSVRFDGFDFKNKYRISNYLGGIQIKTTKKMVRASSRFFTP